MQQDIEREEEAHNQAYGTQDRSEWLAKQRNIWARWDDLRGSKSPDTLREDHHIGIDEGGKFYVWYKGSCLVCGFCFEYRHQEAT